MAHLREARGDSWSESVRWDDVGYGEFIWRMAERGKYRGMTLPHMMMRDPAYSYEALRGQQLTGEAFRQGNIVASRACHILPPKSAGENARFYFELGRKDHLRTLTVAARKPQADPAATVVKRKHLNLAVVQQLAKREDAKGIAVLTAFVMQNYFSGTSTLKPRRAELFFENDDNFELTCRKRHLLPREQRRDDRRRR